MKQRKKQIKIYPTEYYNLDMIISIGFRVKSGRGTDFRKYANTVRKKYRKESIKEYTP